MNKITRVFSAIHNYTATQEAVPDEPLIDQTVLLEHAFG